MDGQCNSMNNIYNVKIESNDKVFNYVGMSAPPLRLRVATHAQSFKNNSNSNQTVLSTKVKELTQQNIEHQVKFYLVENTESYTPESKKCNLCLAESYQILYGNYENLLNGKSEVISKCRHRAKFKLGNV